MDRQTIGYCISWTGLISGAKTKLFYNVPQVGCAVYKRIETMIYIPVGVLGHTVHVHVIGRYSYLGEDCVKNCFILISNSKKE